MKLHTLTGTTIKVTHVGIDYGKVEVKSTVGKSVQVEEFEIPKRLAQFLRQVSHVKRG